MGGEDRKRADYKKCEKHPPTTAEIPKFPFNKRN